VTVKETHRPLVVAHRGSSGSAPENTMAAFRAAANAGADMIEFDVRRTLDDKLVVYHDRILGRTGEGRGALRRLSARELAGIDAGAWFGPRFRGERIPTLRRVLEEIPLRVGMNIEVKTDGDLRDRRSLAHLLAGEIAAAGAHRTIIVSSFDHGFLVRLRALAPALSTGALYLPLRDRMRGPARIARRTGATVFICSRAQLRPGLLRAARQAGLAVSVYGVNTAAHLRAALHAGVDAVITDYPERVLRALGRS
jgi:glycerophosphoryl diester phosphodiesterase